jgi:hypothetical protein
LSGKHERKSRPPSERSDEPDPEPQDGERATRAAEISSETDTVVDGIDKLLDDIDQTLLKSLGFEPGEAVDPAEVTKRAEGMVSGYIQKGGQ